VFSETANAVVSRLRDYQLAGAAFLTERSGALLADEMGLGKTVQCVVALETTLARIDGAARALVITPAALQLNWLAEINKWAPAIHAQLLRGNAHDRGATLALPIPVILATYEQIRMSILAGGVQTVFDIVVLDEAQRIKNPDSSTSIACRLLRRHRSWALTGTPVENCLDDLYTIYDFVKPGLLLRTMSLRNMHQRILPHFLRRRKQDVLPELPPIHTQDLRIELTPAQRRTYDDLYIEATTSLKSQSADDMNMLALLTRLKVVCNIDPATQESAKLDALQVFLDGAIGDRTKVLVFSQFVSTLEYLADRIEYPPTHLYHGGMNSTERDAALARFKQGSGPRVLLMSIRAGGVGLNLPEADTVVLFDRWWNPAVENQAVHRAHRFGRQSPLFVIRFLAEDTVESRINDVLQRKARLFATAVDGISGAATGLTKTDLLAILSIWTDESIPQGKGVDDVTD